MDDYVSKVEKRPCTVIINNQFFWLVYFCFLILGTWDDRKNKTKSRQYALQTWGKKQAKKKDYNLRIIYFVYWSTWKYINSKSLIRRIAQQSFCQWDSEITELDVKIMHLNIFKYFFLYNLKDPNPEKKYLVEKLNFCFKKIINALKVKL